jgi:uncharacterized protein YndB with AHSA1/START domain
MTEILTFSFDVACAPEHAFEVWTARIDSWWPRDHTVGGEREVEVVLEPGTGGLIFERGEDGTRHVWGEVTSWEPPHRLTYRWHIGRPAQEATDVSIRFSAIEADRTRVDIEQTGFDRFGEQAEDRRNRNRIGWGSLLPHFATAIEEDRRHG